MFFADYKFNEAYVPVLYMLCRILVRSCGSGRIGIFPTADPVQDPTLTRYLELFILKIEIIFSKSCVKVAVLN